MSSAGNVQNSMIAGGQQSCRAQGRASKVKESFATWPASKPLRLIQYLGSKLRSLSEVVPVIEQNTPENGSCLDLFAGTTVVGQGLLQHCSVLSNDCLFSKVFGDVLIAGPESQRTLLSRPETSWVADL